MRWLSPVIATLLGGALVAAAGLPAYADDGGGDCAVTVQLPATAESGQPFTMQVVESSGCAGVSGLQPFTVDDFLTDGPLRWGQDGIRFTHTPGTGDATYQGTAPNPGTWQPRLLGLGTDPGYRVVLTTMTTTPQITPTPTTPPAKAVWLNDTLRVVYPYVPTYGAGIDEYWTVFVDGRRVAVDEYPAGAYGAVDVPRKASAGPADVRIVGTNVADIADISADTDTTIYARTITRRAVEPKKGQVSAATLLSRLKVRAETRSSTYASSRFGPQVDADHDGQDTRAEVLRSESLKKVGTRHGVITSGRWLSRYDGLTVTDPAGLAVDHLVPLQEAWTSGAASWSAKRRTAYANDLGYGSSLIAVSKAALTAKGAKEPSAYLPSDAADRCAYVRSWIAVKYRWGLSIDSAEKRSLDSDLTRFCTNLFVTKPAAPDLTSLVSRPRG